MTGEQVIVFGGSGFLGSHVCDALTDAGYKVRIFDARVSPYLRAGQEMVVGDMLDAAAVAAAARGCGYVYNFAAIADIDEARDHPVETAAINVMGNMYALEAARAAGARRFVFASTIYVFSNSGSFYRASKQAAERFIETYHDRYGLPYTVLRYGSLYGRRADGRNSIFRMLRAAMTAGVISYTGDPDAIREYIHVSDAARLSVKVLEEEFANRHLILTGQERMRVHDLMRMIAEMMPNQVRLEFLPNTRDGHYVVTPYAYNPRVGHKLVAADHVDLGQGLLDCLTEVEGAGDVDEMVGLTIHSCDNRA
jgi:UDP-glucose 4-epimerase